MTEKEWIPISEIEPVEGEVYEVKYISENGEGIIEGVYEERGIVVDHSFFWEHPHTEITHVRRKDE